MPKLSIITPVYKVERYLPKCIDSILSQKFSDFELIIVDDGSPDNSGHIADEYKKKDPRIKVIHKENGGAPSARNAGIDCAKGEYLYFPDSDDWLDADYLKALIDEGDETNADLVISGFVMEYHDKNKSQSYSVSVPRANYNNQNQVRLNLHKYFNNMMIAVPWNKLYRTDYIKKNNLKFPNIKWDDLHFNMEVIRNIDRVAISDSTGYHFLRARPGSETTLVFDKVLYKKRKEQFEHILSVYSQWGVLSETSISTTIYGYYSSRLVQCIVELSISNSEDKISQIRALLNDNLTKLALKEGKIDSIPLALASIPMKLNNTTLCFFCGKILGYIKLNMSSLFYKVKALTVNKAKQ